MLHPAFLHRPIAHRGLHEVTLGRLENSRAAFRAAVEAGYGIELDLQLSSDGEAMVFHDYDLRRLTAETGPVRQRTAEALGRIELSGGAETIPTLPEVLELVSGHAPLLLELKDQDGALGPGIGGLEAAVARSLRAYDGPVAVMSFNPHSVMEMGRLAPGLTRGLTTGAFAEKDWGLVPEAVRTRLRNIPDFVSAGASFISHDARDLGNPSVARLKSEGVPILCWTVRSPEEAARARQVADNVTFESYLPA